MCIPEKLSNCYKSEKQFPRTIGCFFTAVYLCTIIVIEIIGVWILLYENSLQYGQLPGKSCQESSFPIKYVAMNVTLIEHVTNLVGSKLRSALSHQISCSLVYSCDLPLPSQTLLLLDRLETAQSSNCVHSPEVGHTPMNSALGFLSKKHNSACGLCTLLNISNCYKSEK